MQAARYVTKGVIVALLTLIVAVFMCAKPQTVHAAEVDTTIRVATVNASPGDSVQVPVSIENNPGVLGAVLQVSYDKGLTLTNATNGDAFAPLSMTKPGSFTSPCKFTWDGVDIEAADIKDGEILVLTFTVADDIESGTTLNVNITGGDGAFLDRNLSTVQVAFSAGSVTIADFIAGDVDGDKVVNSRDVIYTRRHIVGGYDQRINVAAADVNNDLKVDSADVILMRRFIAGGYGVDLKQSRMNNEEETEKPHVHEFEAVAALSPTCTEDGNIAYWHCGSCDKYFGDAQGNSEIQKADTVVPAMGHVVVVDAAVAPTQTTTGLTEGAHCSVCGEILKVQETIPVLDIDEYFITYDIANGDSYIASQAIANPNKTSYFEGDSFRLSNLSVPGYRFLGWYDAAGTDATKVSRIDTTTAEDLELFAHWEALTYTVQFESDVFIDTNSATYTVGKGLVLPTPKLSNYVFAGWSDDQGTLYDKRIPVGSTGDITLNANWTSERNKTYANPSPSDPIVYEDKVYFEEDGNHDVILMAYEIGRIENVPLYTIKDWGYIGGDGVTRTETTTYTASTSETTAETISNAVANATTNSSNWTLSSGWNETTSVTEQWCEQHGVTKEEAETISKSNSTNWNVSNSSYGSSTTTSSSTDTKGWTQDVKVDTSQSHTGTTGYKTTAELSASLTAGTEMGATVGNDAVGSASVSSSLSATVSGSIANETSGSQSQTGSRGVSTGHADNYSGMTSSGSSSTSGWNKSSSYGGSSTTSKSNTVSTAISDIVSKSKGYGKSYAQSGSETQGLATSETQTQTDSYSSAVTYNTATSESVTSTWTTAATKAGYHRWVVAGTAHVYGVVGYDIKTKSFFVYTYSVMDDETHEFEDYSYTTKDFNDNENGVISFEVPYEEVMLAVSDRVYASEGLKVDLETGTVVGFTGSDTCVIIPEYYNAGNGDVVKITGLASDVFAGKADIVTVILSDYIAKIPDGAFAGCSKLAFVKGSGVTSVGARAFANCPAMEECGVFSQVAHLGDRAFDGAEHLFVNAANKNVVAAALSSGAKQLTLNLRFLEDDNAVLEGTTLSAPSSMDLFELNGASHKDGPNKGNPRTFKGLSIASNASKTLINDVNITGTIDSNSTETELNRVNVAGEVSLLVKIASPNVVLNQSSITSPGIALALTTKDVQVGLRGTTTVSSGTANAMLCRSAAFFETADNVVGKLKIPAPKKLLVCGSLTGTQYIECSNIETISEAEFEKLLKTGGAYTLSFDPGKGTCEEASRLYLNGSPLGELPDAVRSGYEFAGWYLADGQTRVTSATSFDSEGDKVVYARWKTTDWVKASEVPTGAEIVDTKYSYDLTSYTSSSSKTLSGWTMYEQKRTSWGSKKGPVYSNPSNGSRNVTSESYEKSRTHYYKYYRYANASGSAGSYAQGPKFPRYEEINLTSKLTVAGTSGGYRYYYNGTNYHTYWESGQWDDIQYGTRWYYQEPVYTYYFKKVEGLESVTKPTGDNISNEVEWVRYIEPITPSATMAKQALSISASVRA